VRADGAFRLCRGSDVAGCGGGGAEEWGGGLAAGPELGEGHVEMFDIPGDADVGAVLVVADFVVDGPGAGTGLLRCEDAGVVRDGLPDLLERLGDVGVVPEFPFDGGSVDLRVSHDGLRLR
jgi:hypothetical protein